MNDESPNTTTTTTKLDSDAELELRERLTFLEHELCSVRASLLGLLAVVALVALVVSRKAVAQ